MDDTAHGFWRVTHDGKWLWLRYVIKGEASRPKGDRPDVKVPVGMEANVYVFPDGPVVLRTERQFRYLVYLILKGGANGRYEQFLDVADVPTSDALRALIDDGTLSRRMKRLALNREMLRCRSWIRNAHVQASSLTEPEPFVANAGFSQNLVDHICKPAQIK